jgi:hypothetical protein
MLENSKESAMNKIQENFIRLTPLNIWLTPSSTGFKKYHITDKTIESLKRKGIIQTSRLIGHEFDKWSFRVKRIK